MGADVLCFAEDIPFEDGSFDVVVTRIAPHHFSDVGSAVREFARVSARLVVVEDTLYSSPDVEAAEKLRDPTHVRNLSEAEWRAAFEDAGLEVDHVEHFRKPIRSTTGSRAPSAPARMPSGCASCSPT